MTINPFPAIFFPCQNIYFAIAYIFCQAHAARKSLFWTGNWIFCWFSVYLQSIRQKWSRVAGSISCNPTRRVWPRWRSDLADVGRSGLKWGWSGAEVRWGWGAIEVRVEVGLRWAEASTCKLVEVLLSQLTRQQNMFKSLQSLLAFPRKPMNNVQNMLISLQNLLAFPRKPINNVQNKLISLQNPLAFPRKPIINVQVNLLGFPKSLLTRLTKGLAWGAAVRPQSENRFNLP